MIDAYVRTALSAIGAPLGSTPSAFLAGLGLLVLVKTFVIPFFSGVSTYFLRGSAPSIKGGYKGRWAVVTGCTDGIGKAIVLRLAKDHKMNIVLVSRTPAKLGETAAEVEKHGVKTATVALDFSTANSATFADPIIKACTGKDVALLVNNAGMSYEHAEYFHLLDSKKIEDLIALNVTSLTKVTHALLPQMIQAKSGAIVNVSSASSLVAEPYYAVYTATKAFVNNFSRALNVEYGPRGITVQSAIPFFVTTKLSKIRKASFTVASEDQYAKALIRDVGKEPLRANFWTHGIQQYFLELFPEALVKKVLLSNALGIRSRAYKKKGLSTKLE